MTPRLSGQNCKFLKLLLSLNCQKRLRFKENNTKYRSLTWKPRRHVRIYIYRTWPNVNLKFPNLRSEGLCDYLLQRRFYQAICSVIAAIGSSSNNDDDGNKNPTNLHIWKWKTVFLHALHVHFSSFDILKTFSSFLRREMTCFAVVWTMLAHDDKCSILSYVPSAGSNLIPGLIEHIFQA